jgi:hypothetical protein
MTENQRLKLISVLCDLLQAAHIHCRLLASYAPISNLQQCRALTLRVYLVSDALHNIPELLAHLGRKDLTKAHDCCPRHTGELKAPARIDCRRED